MPSEVHTRLPYITNQFHYAEVEYGGYSISWPMTGVGCIHALSFIRTQGLKTPKIYEHAVKQLEAEKRQRAFTLDTVQNHGNTLILS